MNKERLLSLGLLGVFARGPNGLVASLPRPLLQAFSIAKVEGIHHPGAPFMSGWFPYVAHRSLEGGSWSLGSFLSGPSKLHHSKFGGSAGLSLQLDAVVTSGPFLKKETSLTFCVPFKSTNNQNSLKLRAQPRAPLCFLTLPLSSRCSFTPVWRIQSRKGTPLTHFQGAALVFQLIQHWKLSLSKQYPSYGKNKGSIYRVQLRYAPLKKAGKGHHYNMVSCLHPRLPSDEEVSLDPVDEPLLNLISEHDYEPSHEVFQELLGSLGSLPIEVVKRGITAERRHPSGNLQNFMHTLFQEIGEHPQQNTELISAVFKRFKEENKEDQKWLAKHTLPFILSNYALCKESSIRGELEVLIQNTEIDDWKAALYEGDILRDLFFEPPLHEEAINLIFETFNETDHDRAWLTKRALPWMLLNYNRCKKLEIWEKLWTVAQEAEIGIWKASLQRLNKLFLSQYIAEQKEPLKFIFERCKKTDADRVWFTKQAISLVFYNYSNPRICNDLLELVQSAEINDWKAALEEAHNLEKFFNTNFLKSKVFFEVVAKFNQSTPDQAWLITRALPYIVSDVYDSAEHLTKTSFLVNPFLEQRDLGDLEDQSISNLLAQIVDIQKERTSCDYHERVSFNGRRLGHECPLYNGFLEFVLTLPADRAYNILIRSGFDLTFVSSSPNSTDGTKNFTLPDGIVERALRLMVLNIEYSKCQPYTGEEREPLLQKINRVKFQLSKIFEKHKDFINATKEASLLPAEVFYREIAPRAFELFQASTTLEAILDQAYGPESNSLVFGSLNTSGAKLSEHFRTNVGSAYELFEAQWNPLIKELLSLECFVG